MFSLDDSLSKQDKIEAKRQEATKENTGIGKLASATNGAAIVANLARVFYKPNTVPMNLSSK